MQAPRTRRHLVLIGASVRAAAEAAARDGWEISAIDQFGDVDTRRAALTWHPLGSPINLAPLVARLPPGGVMVTGGMEDWYEMLDAIRPDREVWVPTTEALRTVREPNFLQDVARRCDFDFPAWMDVRKGAAPDGWLVKSRRLSGGRGVGRATRLLPAGDCYFQARTAGRPFGAAFLATETDTLLIGLTRSMTRAVGHRPFMYTGSVGPVNATIEARQKLRWLGETIRRRMSLRGLFGVDLLAAPNSERISLLEINPRYTAGMELLENFRSRSLVTSHLEAWRGQAARLPDIPATCRVKRVVWAQHSLRWNPRWQLQMADAFPSLTLHDLPQPGSAIDAGEPLVTVWAEGEQMGEPLRQVRHLETQLLRLVAKQSLAPRE